MDAFLDAVTDADGVAPFNEATLLHLDRREAFREERDGVLVGLALGHRLDDGRFEAELAVHPEARRQGVGSALVERLQQRAPLVFWAHGNTAGAQALAARCGLRPVRELQMLERVLQRELPEVQVPEGVRLRSFDPARDAEAWVELNARAFADHPEQGKLTLQDLRQRMDQTWFDAERFLVAERDGALVGFHWLKGHEVYVVGVDPAAAGRGLGRALTIAGLRLMQEEGLHTAVLYVDASNTPAVALYDRLGFALRSVDVQYA